MSFMQFKTFVFKISTNVTLSGIQQADVRKGIHFLQSSVLVRVSNCFQHYQLNCTLQGLFSKRQIICIQLNELLVF